MAKVVIDDDGNKTYYENGLIHRDDGPAVIAPDGRLQYYRHNVPINSHYHMCPDRWADGSARWYVSTLDSYGKRAAMDFPNGRKIWVENGEFLWPEL